MAHRDGYTAFVSSGLGKKISTTLGLPQPVALRRHVPGRPLVDGPVLVQVPRRGYLPSLSCAECRNPVRCSRCRGPVSVTGSGAPPSCR